MRGWNLRFCSAHNASSARNKIADVFNKRKPGRPTIDSITPAQERVLKAIETHIAREGMSPTIREIADRLELGVASVFKLVERLERNGYVGRSSGKSRSLTVLRSAKDKTKDPVGLVSIPLLGTVAAGAPIFAPENQMGELLVESSSLESGRHFALRVSGESMRDAGMDSGDILIVRQQPLADHREIVVALLNQEATVKRLHHRDGEIRLIPENPDFKPIPVEPEDDFRIVGKVVAVRRMARK